MLRVDDRRLFALAASAVLLCAVALAARQTALAGAVATAPLLAAAAGAVGTRSRRIPAAERAVALVWLLLAASTFVWRYRSTQALNGNPLDRAAIVRVGFVVAAALLTGALLVTTRAAARTIPLPLGLLGGYIAAGAVAATSSPLPLQALYRVCELAVGFLAVYLALALLGDRAGRAVVRLSLLGVALLTGLVWVEALVIPGRAWMPAPSVLPYELQGALPSFSSNSVGTFGALLALWGAARPGHGKHAALLANAALVGGMATLVASQYRTGLIGVVGAGAFVAWRRRPRLAVALVAAAALLVVYVGWTEVRAATQAGFAKGHPELVASLDSRTTYWHAAVPAIRERPFFGWGLNVGSRQVLVSIGDVSTSTVHGTWFEAALGAGLVGAAFLAAALGTGLLRAWRARSDPTGIAVFGMLLFLVVRSLTGPTVELFDLLFLVGGALLLASSQIEEEVRRC